MLSAQVSKDNLAAATSFTTFVAIASAAMPSLDFLRLLETVSEICVRKRKGNSPVPNREQKLEEAGPSLRESLLLGLESSLGGELGRLGKDDGQNTCGKKLRELVHASGTETAQETVCIVFIFRATLCLFFARRSAKVLFSKRIL